MNTTMDTRFLLFLSLVALLITNDASAGRSGSSRGGSSRGGSSRGGSSSHYSSSGHSYSRPTGSSSGSSRSSPSTYGHSSTSGRQTSSSNHVGSSSSGHTTGSNPYGHGSSSNGHATGSNSYGHGSSLGGHTAGSSPYGHGSSSGGHTVGSNPYGHASSSGQTPHQNKDSSTSLLHAEGGGATRPPQNNPAQSSLGRPSAPYGNTGTYPGNRGKPDFTTENKQNVAPYNPSAPPIDHLSKSTVTSSQNHAPTSFGQPNAPFNPSHGTVPHTNPSWSNPHYNPSQPHPPGPISTNIGFKDHLRPPTSMPIPSHASSAPHPQPPYPTTNFNQRPPLPHSVHPSTSHPYQPHSTYNPSYPLPSQTFGHPSSYPAHIPPPMPNTFGNPYSTHPVGSAYGPTGHSYYPQQHVLAQPASQPFIPGQTVVMVPGQQNSGRGFGQMVKEALVFSTINAGVNRLINPHHHHYMSDRPTSSGTTSETHITYNNHYFNGAPSDNIHPLVPPASPNVPQSGASPTYPVNYPVNNPVITPGVSIPTIVGNNGSVANPTDSSFASTTSTTNNIGGPPAVAGNGQSFAGNTMNKQEAPNQSTNFPQYKISDNELWSLTEELFAKQEINVSKYLTLHLQSVVKNVTDEAGGPLIYTQQEVYDYPTILVIRALYDTYEHNSTMKENRTPAIRKKENLLLDVFLNTNVMVRAMQWLSDRGFIDPDDFERMDTLRHIWFTQFDGATSGFERVFTSEKYGSDLLGVQDWIYFDYQESKRRIDYMGYVDTLKLGENASLLKLNFQMDGIIRPNATIFVGTLPELEMSLYTICFYARPNDLCPVSLGGAKFNIYTHSFRYYGKDLIDLALPIF